MFFHILKILIKLTYLIFKVYLTQPQTIRRYVRWLALNPCRQESLHPKRLSNGKQVDSRIYPSLQKMFNDARANGLALFVREGYRTAQDQQQIMNERIREYENQGYSKPQATKMAEKYVAIPGTSEHQLGLSVDINANQTKCSSEKVYSWLDNNAYKYGFIKRYPSNKSYITRIHNEPWHYRYVGKEAAATMKNQNLCLEEYLKKYK